MWAGKKKIAKMPGFFGLDWFWRVFFVWNKNTTKRLKRNIINLQHIVKAAVFGTKCRCMSINSPSYVGENCFAPLKNVR